jgi:hypothetical protein
MCVISATREMKVERLHYKIILSKNAKPNLKKNSKSELSTVAHTCNLSYSGSRDWEGSGWKPTQQKVSETPISTNKPTVVVYACHLSCIKGIGPSQSRVVQTKKPDTFLKINKVERAIKTKYISYPQIPYFSILLKSPVIYSK